MPVNAWTMVATLAGGLGLFLLGMTMMTDGLKLAAGPALERVLTRATRTRWHALTSGALMTAVVQSSSAVTVAAIGFVNAGLMRLAPALWVLFGANVGTTMTGWIVALVGLKFKIGALALTLIGVGVVARLTGAGERRGALGSAVAGLGLLFLGIAMLQEAFVGVAASVELPDGRGVLGTVAQVGVGALLTVLMQSSSASMTVALTAAQGGLMTPEGAAAMVIGANIGTTFKAMLAAIGATPNARRAAAAHVIFNVLTGLVALALLPWLVGAIAAGRAALGLASDPAIRLALFHTIFNVLGVLLMWPLAGALTRWLQQRFRAAEEDEAQPQHLDDTVLAVPTLALDALKGYLPVLLALVLGPRFGLGETTVALVGLAAFVGHLWPVFFRFRGGKGVATAAGVLLALNPWLGAATLVTWVVIAAFFRYASLAAIVAAAFAVFYQLLIWGVEPALLAVAPMSVLLVWRHEANIRKLLAGTESRIGHKAGGARTGVTTPAAGHRHAHGHKHHAKKARR